MKLIKDKHLVEDYIRVDDLQTQASKVGLLFSNSAKVYYDAELANAVKDLALKETNPEFGTYTILSTLGTIVLGNVYDLRWTNEDSASLNISSFSGGKDGYEYIISILNNYSGELTINLPTSSSIITSSSTLKIPSGSVGEISVRYIFDKYVIKI